MDNSNSAPVTSVITFLSPATAPTPHTPGIAACPLEFQLGESPLLLPGGLVSPCSWHPIALSLMSTDVKPLSCHNLNPDVPAAWHGALPRLPLSCVSYFTVASPLQGERDSREGRCFCSTPCCLHTSGIMPRPRWMPRKRPEYVMVGGHLSRGS